MIDLVTNGISLTFDPSLGQIARFTVIDRDREIAPLHRAPWDQSDEVLPKGLAPHLYHLGGDFFCAPFAQERDGAPAHGWPPNAQWHVQEAAGNRLLAQLSKQVNGASLTKELWLHPGQPFVYQRHVFFGGAGHLPVANHANVALANGGLIRTSKKQVWATPPEPLEQDAARGRSGLRYPGTSRDPKAFPADGGTTDLTCYPWFHGCEDFVSAVEAPGHNLGWTAVTRPTEGDLFLSLRRADRLPMTMLWHSNGGRSYPPWSGRHFGCLGVEEGAAEHMLGNRYGIELAGPGELALDPNSSVSVTHVIGAIAWPGGSGIHDVAMTSGQLAVTGEDGAYRELVFDNAALDLN